MAEPHNFVISANKLLCETVRTKTKHRFVRMVFKDKDPHRMADIKRRLTMGSVAPPHLLEAIPLGPDHNQGRLGNLALEKSGLP